MRNNNRYSRDNNDRRLRRRWRLMITTLPFSIWTAHWPRTPRGAGDGGDGDGGGGDRT